MRTLFRWLRRALAAVVVLLLLAAAAVAASVWLSMPGRGGDAVIAGLGAPVSVTLDADGVPRIQAASEVDAAAALGWLHARERMFQMELMRRAAAGELSELFGVATLPIDRLMRTLGLRMHAASDLPGLPADTRKLLDAYARGVNAFIDSRGRFASPEFVVFGRPRPWTALDSLLWGKTMSLYLSGNWREERARLVLDAALPPATVDELWPDGGGNGHPEARLTAPGLTRLATLLAAALPEFPAPFTLPDSASNAWAVDGRHSATGAPLLAGDPHLGYSFPGIWYLARIDTPGLTLAGATAPGVPFLVLGHNGHIAWSFTTTGADVQDLFLETPAGDGSHYQTPNGPQAYVLRDETIHVRGQPDTVLTVRETRHGPVVSDLVDPKGPVLALRAADLAPGDYAADGLLALNHARDVAAAGRAAARITSPVQNMMVADAHSIGLFVTGRVPVRLAGDGARPVQGGDGKHDWTGWASGDALPHYVNPDSGHLLNANERVAPPDFPVFLGRTWYDDDRARRIRDLLAATDRHTTASFAAMQSDVVSLAARDLLPILTALPPARLPSAGPARAALALLSGWDGSATRETPQPLIFNAWMQHFDSALLAHLNVPAAARPAVAPWPRLLRHALSPAGAHWCDGDCTPLLASSLDTATKELADRFGPDPAAWRWGTAHRAVFAHPLLRALPVIGKLAEIGIDAPGDDATLDSGGVQWASYEDIHGPSYRGVYDLSDLDRSLFMMAPGQSGNPFSRQARNFLARWRDGDSVMLGREPQSVAARFQLSPNQPPP
jgi:penicillin amidase